MNWLWPELTNARPNLFRWDVSSQGRGGDSKVIADMTAKVIASYNVTPSRVFVGGLSAGAAQSVLVAIGSRHSLSSSLFS
jgi:poly(3-hydroxybutyrate) depolymerase